MLSAWINVRQTDAGDLTAAQLCCTCYSPGVRADAIWVSRHKHGRGVSGAVLFITRIVINGSPGPSQSAGLEPRIKILHSDWVAVQRARWVIGIAVIILLDISSWTPHLSAPSARIIRCICWMLTSAQSWTYRCSRSSTFHCACLLKYLQNFFFFFFFFNRSSYSEF